MTSGDALPISDERARRAAAGALDLDGADGVEVVVTGSSTGVTRYAASQVIQNTYRLESRAYVRAVIDHRVAVASTTTIEPAAVAEAGRRALAAARVSPPDEEFPGLPRPDEVGRATPLFRWDDATASASPEDRAAAVRRILAAAETHDAAGTYETSAHGFGIFSTSGVACFDAYTRCVTTCLVDVGGATGWGDASSHRMASVDEEASARRALVKARRSAAASDGAPGVYSVVLEPAAVATLLEYLSYSGLGAKQVIEGESFLSTRAGDQVADPRVTVADDVTHDLSVGIGFDLEGVPKQRVAVIDAGRATGPVTDLRTAAKLQAPVTGHYSGAAEFGPYASNVVMEAGGSSLDQMIDAVHDGYLVTRFHYVNVLDRPNALLTGMTRDGTFRIRRGEIGEPVRNFRFAQGVLEALASVEAVGSELKAFAPEYASFGSTVAPALAVGEFRFASTTSH